MGQKVSPVGLRIGINKTWESKWYAGNNDFAKFLGNDHKIRKFLEKKLKLDKDKSMRILEMKADVDEKWKAPTERWIEAKIKQEFFDQDLEITTSKTVYELLIQKAWVITEFVNIVKMNKKANFSI